MRTFDIVPMEPILRLAPFSDPDFIYQVKWDGVRMLMDRSGTEVALWNRRGRSRTRVYPELVSSGLRLETTDVLLDGELISLNASGRPDFQNILRRDLAKLPRTDIPVVYVVFDCLRLGGKWMLNEPLEDRQEVAATALKGAEGLTTCDNFNDGVALFRKMQDMNMEGIVAKQRGSRYYPGKKHFTWQKVKCWRYLDVVPIAVNLRDGRPSSVTVAKLDDPLHTAVANVASGLSAETWRALRELAEIPLTATGQTSFPLPPDLVFTIQYLDWTNSGRLRSPSVKDVRAL